MRSPRPLRALVLLALPLALLLPGPAASQGPCEVREGYDLFVTVEGGTTLGVQPALDLFHYRGVPVRSYEFEGVGQRDTGNVDTIVRRLSTATPATPVVPVELVLLQLQSVEGAHAITLQSARLPGEAPGLQSVGSLQILFNSDCKGGTLNSQFTVNFDVRLGGIDGPIVLSGSEAITANGIPWVHDAPDVRELTEQGRIAAHQVRDEVTSRIFGVNDRLNGFDRSSDFHPGTSVAA